MSISGGSQRRAIWKNRLLGLGLGGVAILMYVAIAFRWKGL